MSTITTSREQFADTASRLVDADENLALVWAEISGQFFESVAAEHPERAINVGIREQLLVSTGAGMAMAGLRPIVHTFGSFLIERPFEQVKLDFVHQGVGGVLVGGGGSFDIASGGRTHQVPGDIALLDTLPGITVHTPSTVRETDQAVRVAAAGEGLHYIRVVDQTNSTSYPVAPTLHRVTDGRRGVVLALGPVLDEVLEATTDLDLAVYYANTIRPFPAHELRAALDGTDVAVVEPWLAGTSAHLITDALRDRPRRLLSLGVKRDVELRKYGSAHDHQRAHGLDAAGIRRSLAAWVG